MGLQRGTLGVLVVEDEYLVASVMEEMLRELGFTNIYLAPTLRQGLSVLVSTAVDLGILDVNIGQDLVFPLASELRSKNVPMVFATGRAAADFPAEWMSYPILSKPVGLPALTRTLHSFGI